MSPANILFFDIRYPPNLLRKLVRMCVGVRRKRERGEGREREGERERGGEREREREREGGRGGRA